jgi:hypothetical protein
VDREFFDDYIKSNMHLDIKKVLESLMENQANEIENNDEKNDFIDIKDVHIGINP